MNRERRIVKMAAAEPTSAKEWLERDEHGTWEKAAGDLIVKTKERAIELDMDEAAVDVAIATELLFTALEALKKDAEKQQ